MQKPIKFNQTQILQARHGYICNLNYPTCDAKGDYINF